ncbi:endonuclease MutS2 [Clostridia bacterium]|nr:endonuclease MutS2 [Clostridia bacterium]
MNMDTITTLEYDKILHILSGYAVSECAKTAILKIAPETDLNAARAEIAKTREAYDMLTRHGVNPVADFDDLSRVLDKCRALSTLSGEEILRAAAHLRAARLFKSGVAAANTPAFVTLNALAASVKLYKNLEDAVAADFSPSGEVNDGASPKLRSVRAKIRAAHAAVREKLNSYLRSPDLNKYLQDEIVTSRRDRYVLSVRAECRGEVPGLVHDRSASGATVFVEPLAVVELNNQIRTLAFDEQAEIDRILSEYTARFAAVAPDMEAAQNALEAADILFAKAQMARETRAAEPELNDKGDCLFNAARHPLIPVDKVVPVDIAFGGGFSVLIISGPNTGGKTVTLKTLGLFCLMAASGLYLPCREPARAAVFGKILCDIGDNQSIENDLSTFSSHMGNIAGILKEFDSNSLLLLDELGAGTDPKEGAALAAAIVKRLAAGGAFAAITTHYSELKEIVNGNSSPQEEGTRNAAGTGGRGGSVNARIRNACVRFDESTCRPTYKLTIGMSGASYALEIARRLGLDDELLNDARQNIDSGKLSYDGMIKRVSEALLQAERERDEAERERKMTEEERAAAARERQKYADLNAGIAQRAKAEAARLAGKAAEQAETLIEQMKELLSQADEPALFAMRKLKNEVVELAARAGIEEPEESVRPAADAEIVPGAAVYVRALRARGTILSVSPKKREARVRLGGAEVILKFGELYCCLS